MRLSIVLKYLSITTFFIAIISLIGFKLFFQKGAGLDNANRGVVAQLQLPAENELGKELSSNNISNPTQKLARTTANRSETRSLTIGHKIKEKAYGLREKIIQGIVETPEEFPSEILDSLSHESDLKVSSLVTKKNEVSSSDPKVVEEEKGGSQPAWITNATSFRFTDSRLPKIAIIIDDAGLNKTMTKYAINLPGPLTISFMSYASRLEQQVNLAKKAGHEVIAHIPMEPFNSSLDPGPRFLSTRHSDKQILKNFRWSLSKVPGIVGVNNHMGSRFTSDQRGMQIVMSELKRQGLLFLDSRTSIDTIGVKLAKKFGVPHAARNIFLDHDPSIKAIKRQLAALTKFATKTGYGIALGHPRKTTIEALSQWLPVLPEHGVLLAPLTEIVLNYQNQEKR